MNCQILSNWHAVSIFSPIGSRSSSGMRWGMSEEDFLDAFVTLEQVVQLQHFVNQILLPGVCKSTV